MTFTEQVAFKALQEALAKVMDAERLCREAGCDGYAVLDSLENAGDEIVVAMRAVEGK